MTNQVKTGIGIFLMLVASAAAQKSVRDVDWKNFSYPVKLKFVNVPIEIQWMSLSDNADTITLANGRYVIPDEGVEDPRYRAGFTFESVRYGRLTGIDSTVALVVLNYHTGGTANWDYVYLYASGPDKPRLLAWLKAGSRASQGLRDAMATDGDLLLVVNDPEQAEGECCSTGSITTRYRWQGNSFSPVGKPEYVTDPPSFDCKKATTPVEQMICHDVHLSSLDRGMAVSYRTVLKDASAERKKIVRQKQAEWFAEYRRTCNAPLSDSQRHECIEQHLNDRLVTIWKVN